MLSLIFPNFSDRVLQLDVIQGEDGKLEKSSKRTEKLQVLDSLEAMNQSIDFISETMASSNSAEELSTEGQGQQNHQPPLSSSCSMEMEISSSCISEEIEEARKDVEQKSILNIKANQIMLGKNSVQEESLPTKFPEQFQESLPESLESITYPSVYKQPKAVESQSELTSEQSYERTVEKTCSNDCIAKDAKITANYSRSIDELLKCVLDEPVCSLHVQSCVPKSEHDSHSQTFEGNSPEGIQMHTISTDCSCGDTFANVAASHDEKEGSFASSWTTTSCLSSPSSGEEMTGVQNVAEEPIRETMPRSLQLIVTNPLEACPDPDHPVAEYSGNCVAEKDVYSPIPREISHTEVKEDIGTASCNGKSSDTPTKRKTKFINWIKKVKGRSSESKC